ncbi:MAG TPA: hypothetical protein VGY77_12445 [Gemmataceae bacterium]|nr:hypothetical protein [Gemmataceae bacterium]
MGIVLVGALDLRAADDSEVVKGQKEAARANWKILFINDPPATEETAHFLLFGSQSMRPRQLQELGASLEKQYSTARTALKIEPKEELWPGKLTVYLLEERSIFNTFMRTIARKRPGADDSGVYSLTAPPFIAASPPQQKFQPTLEGQAGEQLATAILTKKCGQSLPDWFVAGFGRAVLWRSAPGAYFQERSQVKKLVRTCSAEDVWNNKPNAEEAALLRASLVEFLAFGPGANYLGKFLEGLKPGENGQPKTTLDALKTVRADFPDTICKSWPAWVAKGR